MQKLEWIEKLQIGDKVIIVHREEKTVATVTRISRKSVHLGSKQFSKFTTYNVFVDKKNIFTNMKRIRFNMSHYEHIIPFDSKIEKELQEEKQMLIEQISIIKLDLLSTNSLQKVLDEINFYIEKDSLK